METHDRRIVYARKFLADARKRNPADLLPDALVHEDSELRRCMAWALDVVDDFADTELDEDVTQVTLWGGRLYLAPAGVAGLRDGCLSRLLDEQHPRATGPRGNGQPSRSAGCGRL